MGSERDLVGVEFEFVMVQAGLRIEISAKDDRQTGRDPAHLLKVGHVFSEHEGLGDLDVGMCGVMIQMSVGDNDPLL